MRWQCGLQNRPVTSSLSCPTCEGKVPCKGQVVRLSIPRGRQGHAAVAVSGLMDRRRHNSKLTFSATDHMGPPV